MSQLETTNAAAPDGLLAAPLTVRWSSAYDGEPVARGLDEFGEFQYTVQRKAMARAAPTDTTEPWHGPEPGTETTLTSADMDELRTEAANYAFTKAWDRIPGREMTRYEQRLWEDEGQMPPACASRAPTKAFAREQYAKRVRELGLDDSLADATWKRRMAAKSKETAAARAAAKAEAEANTRDDMYERLTDMIVFKHTCRDLNKYVSDFNQDPRTAAEIVQSMIDVAAELGGDFRTKAKRLRVFDRRFNDKFGHLLNNKEDALEVVRCSLKCRFAERDEMVARMRAEAERRRLELQAEIAAARQVAPPTTAGTKAPVDFYQIVRSITKPRDGEESPPGWKAVRRAASKAVRAGVDPRPATKAALEAWQQDYLHAELPPHDRSRLLAYAINRAQQA